FVGVAGSRAGSGGSGSALESGPVSEDAESLGPAGDGPLGRLLRRPGSWLVLALGVVTLLAWRGLLVGGALQGGGLLAAPPGSSDLWQRYLEAWQEVGVGSSTAAPPWIAAVAAAATVALGRPETVVSLLLLLSVPLAGATSYLFLRRVTGSVALRWWGAVT